MQLLGIGVACVVEPSASNMGYITLVDPAERRAATLPKDGNAETVTRSRWTPAAGSASAFTSTPQGQGHRTVAAQIVADALGVRPGDVTVHPGADTAGPAVHRQLRQLLQPLRRDGGQRRPQAATQLAERVRAVAAELLECAPATWSSSTAPPG